MARIRTGITRYWGEQVEPTMANHVSGSDESLLVPVEGRAGKAAITAGTPLRTQTTRNETGIAFPPFVAELRGGGSVARPAAHPLSTVTASGNHHALIMRNNSGGAEMTTPASEPVRTITTAGHQSLITGGTPTIEDVWFRMLAPHEIKRAMAFPGEYIVLGTKREQVRMSGNAVTPPAARDRVGAVADSLT